MTNSNITKVHISQVRGGDAIMFNGEVKTVSNCDIKYCTFMGTTIFGDNYRCGNKLVEVVYFNRK